MEQYQFKDPAVYRLVQSALKGAWNPLEDLPWDLEVQPKTQSACSSLLIELPEFKKLSIAQQQDYQTKESVYHISNLLAGEHKGVRLAAQILLGCPDQSLDWPYFVSTILSDERNHVIALTRYLKDKMGFYYAPHPRIEKVLTDLLGESAYDIKLFVSQVVLEWTATSLLASMLSKNPEPLFNQILRKIIRDESRHLLFNRIVNSNLTDESRQMRRRSTEDLLFESIVACVSALCAIPVWKEYGFKKSSCQQFALEEMNRRGVIHFYQNILPKELHRCNFHSDRLIRLLQEELPKQIISDHWTFEPNVQVA